MQIIRAVTEDDLDDLMALAAGAGSGLTTLPSERDDMAARIRWSLDSFAAEVDVAGEQYYMLVLEDEPEDGSRGRVIGTSAVFATVGLSKPFYNYRLLKLSQACTDLGMKVDTELLLLGNDFAGASELATLYLESASRGTAIGRQLSRARYLLMAAHRTRFADVVMAELRGWTDENGSSPFWEVVGRPFFQMEFDEADRISGQGNSQFIADLMPKFPIYTNLLPQSARDVIGRPHDQSAAALKLLKNEGFHFRGAVDIFDAGPCVEARLEQIKSVREARSAVLGTDEPSGGVPSLVANPALDNFRVGVGLVEYRGGETLLEAGLMGSLGLAAGGEVITIPAPPKVKK